MARRRARLPRIRMVIRGLCPSARRATSADRPARRIAHPRMSSRDSVVVGRVTAVASRRGSAHAAFGAPDGVHVVGCSAARSFVKRLESRPSARRRPARPPALVAPPTRSTVVLGCGAILLRRLRTPHRDETHARRRVGDTPQGPRGARPGAGLHRHGRSRRLAWARSLRRGHRGRTGSCGRADESSQRAKHLERRHPRLPSAGAGLCSSSLGSSPPSSSTPPLLADEVRLRTDRRTYTPRPGSRRVVLVDTTDRKRLESQLIHDALTIVLTVLAAIPAFCCATTSSAPLGVRPRARVASPLLFVDLDDFKRSTTPSATWADDILCRVAERSTRAVREGDVVGRHGSGDELRPSCSSTSSRVRRARPADPRELRRPIQGAAAGDRSSTIARHRVATLQLG